MHENFFSTWEKLTKVKIINFGITTFVNARGPSSVKGRLSPKTAVITGLGTPAMWD